MCSNSVQENSGELTQKKCVQLHGKVNNDSHGGSCSDSALDNSGEGGVVKKVAFKIGSQVLGETDLLSESEEENLVMDFSENEDEKLFT